MRKSGIAFVILVLLGLGFYFFATKYEIKIGAFQFVFSKEKKLLQELTSAFLEDIQFKDFDKAATYHTVEDQKTVDIPDLLERLFQIKPELLDIMKYEITGVEVDKSGTRARVKTHTTVKLLNTDEIKEPDLIFYWHKQGEQWYMKLESSLQ
jgi:hypothetical protein